MTIEQCSEEPRDDFPVGMRVLAVDDDPICLKVLETKLRKCQYHVTTTNQAIVALKLLRDNKNKFDLVISDVHMPDMDGFKLLELVGLEMDLPVIMLSANGDQRLVMKGITHGACDYLLKPVRIEELKNIWQHVIRKKKSDSKDKNSDKPHYGSEEGQSFNATGDSDQNGKMNRKRKDQVEDDDEDRGEYGQDNEDSSAQKKPRVVWTVDLHQKFVAAVNQLGIEKAVPKRILDMMNVDKLTRENVASHLQKYRLYLRRISSVQSQQANMAAAFGGVDPAYLRMSSLNGFGNIHSMASAAQLQNAAALRSFSSSGMLGRLNTPAGLGMRGISSPGVVQLGHGENLSNHISVQNNFQPVGLQGRQNVNILQGVPTSLDFEHLTNDPMGFPVTSGFSAGNMNYNSTGIQSSTTVTSNREVPLDLPDLTRFNDGWPTIQSSAVQSSSLRDNAAIGMAAANNYPAFPSAAPIGGGFSDLRTDFQCQSASTVQYPNLMSNSVGSVGAYGVSGSFNQGLDVKSNRMNDVDTIGQQNLVDPLIVPESGFQQSAIGGGAPGRVKQGYTLDQRIPQGGYSYNNVGCLEDLVSAMMKKEEDEFSSDFGLR